jgi:transcriptional regulator with XRE-family HTH domain
MKTEKLNKKYTSNELADSFVFRNTLTAQQKEDAGKQLEEARKKAKKQHTSGDILYAGVLQLRYRIEEYTGSSLYKADLSFAYFLRAYIKLNYKNNKDFAKDIHLDETELSQVLNGHRSPSEKTLIRLELHSNKMIPALCWFKLLEKEKEYELETDNALREREEKYVRNRLPLHLPKIKEKKI